MPEPGVYHYPGLPENDSQQEWQKVIKKSKEGPVISLFVYLPNGTNPMSPAKFIYSLIVNLLSVLGSVFLLTQTRLEKYSEKVLFAGLLGLFAGFVGPVSELGWFGFPLFYTFILILDLIIGWTLVGLVVSKFINVNTGNSIKL